MKNIKTALGGGLLLMSAIAAGSCSSVRPPREQLATAELAVQQAQSSKAPQHAPLELRLALEKPIRRSKRCAKKIMLPRGALPSKHGSMQS